MRVISGSRKGRKLARIEGNRIRPTSDRTKEAIFNILGQSVHQARVLDLFSGTGALGIEALSRGANHAVFIDCECDIIRKNIELCRFEDKSTVIVHDIIRLPLPDSLKGGLFDIVFIDPPYKTGYIEATLEKQGFVDLLAPDAMIIAEHSCKESLKSNVSSLDIFRQKKYSKTIISFISKG